MERFYGFIADGYRFETLVPTTIFEEKVALIRAYKGRNLLIEKHVPLKEMPQWNPAFQCIELCKKDEKSLEQRTKALMKELKTSE
ncbi:MAG: hypothetical protein V1734_04415 [Nanoarchaeota archaeon]